MFINKVFLTEGDTCIFTLMHDGYFIYFLSQWFTEKTYILTKDCSSVGVDITFSPII